MRRALSTAVVVVALAAVAACSGNQEVILVNPSDSELSVTYGVVDAAAICIQPAEILPSLKTISVPARGSVSLTAAIGEKQVLSVRARDASQTPVASVDISSRQLSDQGFIVDLGEQQRLEQEWARSTDEEKEKQISNSRTAFDTRFVEWVAEFGSREIDPRSLPQVDGIFDFLEPPPSDLDTAIAEADVIVVGAANRLAFEVNGTSVAFAVGESLKGLADEEINITQPGGPAPCPDWETAVLAVAEEDPLLMPDDRAVLFLNFYEDSDRYYAQPWTGQYRIEAGGEVSALEGNSFAESVNDLTVDDFIAMVRTIAARQAAQ